MGLREWLRGDDIDTRAAQVRDLEARTITPPPPLEYQFDQVIDDHAAGIAPENIPAAFRGVQLITDLVASLPLVAVDRSSGLRRDDTPPVLERPDPDETRHATLSKIVSSLLFRGNAVLELLDFGAGPRPVSTATHPAEFRVLHPDDVSITWADHRRQRRRYTVGGRDLELGTQLAHIQLNYFPGEVAGVSPFTAARILMAGARAQLGFSRALWEDDASPSGVLKVPQRLDTDEAHELQAGWESAHRNRRRPAVLSGGAEWEALTFTPHDAEFIASQDMTVRQIATLLGLHGFFLNTDAGSSLTYATTESLFRVLLTGTIQPTYLERIEQTFSTLLPRTTEARFVTDDVVKADLGARYNAYASALTAGWMTVNEVRQREGLSPSVTGDDLAAGAGVTAAEVTP